jgi:hypothetical protein
MSVGVFVIALGIGCAALAVWVDYRLETFRPGNLYTAMVHVGLAMLLARLIVPVGMTWVGNLTSALGGVFLVGLPVCVYCLLSCFWVMRQVGDTLGNARQGPGAGAS